MRQHQNGQVTVEMAVLFTCVVGALIWLSFYVQRAAQGNIKSNADSLGTQYSMNSGWSSHSEQLSAETATNARSGSCSDTTHNLTAGTAAVTNLNCTPTPP